MLIKNDLLSTMSQERLCGLALMSIEASRAKSIDANQVIQHFAEMKARHGK